MKNINDAIVAKNSARMTYHMISEVVNDFKIKMSGLNDDANRYLPGSHL